MKARALVGPKVNKYNTILKTFFHKHHQHIPIHVQHIMLFWVLAHLWIRTNIQTSAGIVLVQPAIIWCFSLAWTLKKPWVVSLWMGDWIAIDFALTAANLKFNMCLLLPYTKLWYTDIALPVSLISPSKTLTIVIAFVVFASHYQGPVFSSHVWKSFVCVLKMCND